MNFTVEQGEVLGIIGRNGAGKSTLLKILSRVTAPTSGVVKVKGRIASLLEVGTGFHPELTGRENIYLNGAILGMTRQEIARKFDEIVDFAEIEKFIDTPVKRYSSGMYVRLAFAVAAHLESEILLVDEVLAVGDTEFQKKCLGKMGDVAKEGRTVFFVSHNMSSITRLCPNSLLLKKGMIDRFGNTREIISYYLQNNVATNFVEATITQNSDKKAQLRQIRLLNSKQEVTNQFTCDDPITIEMLFQVNQRIKGLYCWLDVSSVDGTLVLMSDSFDANPNPLENLTRGLHKIIVQIPPRSLGHGNYCINLVFSEPGNRSAIDNFSLGCNFTLDDFTSKRGNKRPGFFSTIPRWSTKHLEEKNESK